MTEPQPVKHAGMATPLIDGMVGKGLIHANKAARYKSRLNTQVKRLATGEQAS